MVPIPRRPSSSSASAVFACIPVRPGSAEAAERVAAEAYAAGAVGLEEREDPQGVALLLYARVGDAEAVRRAVARVGAPVRVAEAVPDVDWSEAWKANLRRAEMLPLLGEISQRLRPGANAVLSGLLASERGSVEAAAGAVGLAAAGARYGDDASGDRWTALLTLR